VQARGPLAVDARDVRVVFPHELPVGSFDDFRVSVGLNLKNAVEVFAWRAQA
jgi:hypothetical protein